MSLALLDAPGSTGVPAALRQPPWTGAAAEPIPELTEERWAQIQERLRATGLPPEPRDDGAAARMFGGAFLLGLGLTGLAAFGLWGLLA